MSQGKGSMYGCVIGTPSSPPRDKSDAVGWRHGEENQSRLMTEMNNRSQEEPETVKMTLEIVKKARSPKVDLTRHHSSSKASRKRRIQE
jgi:hypothetical protein